MQYWEGKSRKITTSSYPAQKSNKKCDSEPFFFFKVAKEMCGQSESQDNLGGTSTHEKKINNVGSTCPTRPMT